MEPGEYPFIITQSDYKPIKSGDGMCLHLSMQCAERGRTNVQLRDFLTLEHDNPTVVEIANARLKQLAVAIGHPKPDFIGDSRELHGKVFLAIVTKERVEQYGDSEGYQNRVAGYKPMPGRPVRPVAQGDDEPPPPTDDDRMGEPAF